MADKKSTEVAKVAPPKYPVLAPEAEGQMQAVIDNIGDEGIQPFDLDRVNIPAGGGTMWQIPTLSGVEDVREVEGIIVCWTAPRVYWEAGLDEGGDPNPPDCSSPDGKYGEGRYAPGSADNPTGACSACPMNQWGSVGDGGKGKACKEQRHLYMIREGGILPLVVALPPTSIQPLRKYMLRLAGEGKPFYGVVTSLAIEAQSSGSFRWGVAVPKLVSVLTEDETKAAQAYGERFSEGLPRSSSTPRTLITDDEPI